jgi:toxin ParE1/3/4
VSHAVVFTPQARRHLRSIYAFLAREASPDIAQRFIDGIVSHMARFSDFPNRGTLREDLRPGLRTTSWRRRVTITFSVEQNSVFVLGIFYGGQDFEALV